MKRLVLVMNGKGGVGKSFFATNFVQMLKDRDVSHRAFDSDNENSTLKRFHPEVEFLDLADPRGLDPMILSLQSVDLAVVDSRAASSEVFLTFLISHDAPALLADLHAELTLAIPIGGDVDSIEQIQCMVESLGGGCRYVLVRNEMLGDRLRLFDAAKIRKRLVDELGAREIAMPSMQPWLVATLNLHGLTPTAGVNHPSLSILDRQRLKTWQRRFNAEIDSAAALLLVGTATRKEEQHGQ